MTIKTIIAAIALEHGEHQVARRAIRLAADNGAKLVLAHAIESLPESDPDLPSPVNQEAIANVLSAEAIASLKQMAESAAVQTKIEVECGKADQLIERLIRHHAADLLVIGPGKPQNLREKIFGSTADRVVRTGLCPIVIVKRAIDEPYRRVIAAIDFSPMSFAAAQTAVQIAPSAKLELIHALEIPLTFEQAMLKIGTSQAEIDQYRQAKAQAAYVELRSVRADLAMVGKIRVVRGDPATALVRLARSGKTDLVALGVQGKNAISKMVLGSVARRVLAGASCDVLLAWEASLRVKADR
ncbi:universal stress protein [Aquamicrobium segne]|uniref:Universal stress protein n=1 Tax=Aquamicrobium segne TaxID=469547 RepID=A0ABW0H1Y4_9HYPH